MTKKDRNGHPLNICKLTEDGIPTLAREKQKAKKEAAVSTKPVVENKVEEILHPAQTLDYLRAYHTLSSIYIFC